MIQRIKKIQQVGTFTDFKTGGSVAIGGKKMAVIFGLNRRGKSTLSAVFQSIGEDEPKYVLERTSIPPVSGIQPQIELSYTDGTDSEQNLSFSSGAWSTTALKDRVLVFDQDFVHRNVMAGSAITRDNKEQFTDFVLGDEGVKLSNAIEVDNKDLRLKKNSLRNFRPKYVKAVVTDEEAEEFAKLNITEKKSEIEKSLEADSKRLARLENIEKFKLLKTPEIKLDDLDKSVKEATEELSNLLKKSYTDVSDEAWKTLSEHIERDCDGEQSVSWLKRGLKINKSKHCPYCGQGLDSAKDLIAAYQSIFDVKFDEYETELSSEAITLKAKFRTLLATSLGSQMTNFIMEAELFSPYIPELQELVSQVREQLDKLTTLEAEYKNALAIWESEVQKLLKQKEQSSHKEIVNSSNNKVLLEKLGVLNKAGKSIERIFSDILGHIEKTQETIEKYNPTQISTEISKIKTAIEAHNKKLARLSEDQESKEYLDKIDEMTKLAKKISDDTVKLEADQTLYLEKYFTRVNHWFGQLGSRGFAIEKESNNKGDKKVYSLRLEFKGQKIKSEDVSKVFSESDRRNLAFSVFLAKAEQLTNKSETILVLDDPVVSFDDNRIDKTCRELKIISPDYKQLIILTHYKSLIKEIVRSRIDANFIEIGSSITGSSLIQMDSSELTLSAHEIACERICAFIDGNDDPDILSTFRPFMEEHLKLVFQRQVRSNNLQSSQLSDLIDSLEQLGLIDATVKIKLDAFRESFNPDHHGTGDDDNVESIRTDAIDLMDFLYTTLIKGATP